MLETLTALLTAHFVADFVLQPEWMITRKRNPLVLLAHAIIVAATVVPFMGGTPMAMLLIVGLTHLAMDATKTYLLKDNQVSFIVDQSVHIS